MTLPDASAPRAAGRQPRPADLSDRQKVADLIFFESQVHRHLDWRTPLDWLGQSPYWVLEEGRHISAALAFPPDPDSIAWIRLFAFASHLSRFSAWPPLWEAARAQLQQAGGGTVSAIATQHWFEQILVDERFALVEQIVLLEWYEGPAQAVQPIPDITIRKMVPQDLPRVAGIDAAAFEPLWRNSVAALTKALEQSSYASVAEGSSGMLGYQMSSGGSFGAHLARLAVLPEDQGHGIGGWLVADLIRHIQDAGGSKVTVNTQASNPSSLALYSRLGFRRTGERFPVYALQVD
ncbi:MAG TPA: N-acetyltransferase [Anaerolineales bacterium]|nr:N-acetyltransferase [Anaerolineales bacterium]